MAPAPQLVFAPFRLDPAQSQLWHGDQLIALQPRPLAVLQYLVERPGQIVSKEELLQAVWTNTHVDKAALKVCVWAIRQALQDHVEAPRYIETIGRRGYRFLGDPPAMASATVAARAPADLVVGRTQELAQLQEWLRRAQDGDRQMVFVAGEPGIGKTTLLDAFLARAQATDYLWTSRGLCIEQYGEGEAYLPVLEALGRLCREPDGQQIVDILARHAPMWLAQMPALLKPELLEDLQQLVAGATRERMLREMTEALEALTTTHTIVLIFEDLQWSDRSTIDLLAYLARRREPARLLVLGTYRPADVVVRRHPLKSMMQELRAHGYCAEMPLELLAEADIDDYIARRFEPQVFPPEFSGFICQRTGGNALFMVTMLDYLVHQNLLREKQGRWQLQADLKTVGAPESLRQLISKQLEELPKDWQCVLEVASIPGTEFAVASVAAALKDEPDKIEQVCEELSWYGRFIREIGLDEWPDGTISGKYAFRHALYQSVIYERLTAARRVRLHRLIAERQEAGYGNRTGEIAAELARHFEQGRDDWRAVRYLRQAADTARQQNAHHESIAYLSRGLARLEQLPESAERAQCELDLQLRLGSAFRTTKSFGTSEVEHAYARARELCQQLNDTARLSQALYVLQNFYLARAELLKVRGLAEELLSLAHDQQDAVRIRDAQFALGLVLFYLGEFASARAHLQAGATLDIPPLSNLSGMASEPRMSCLSFAAFALWFLGYPDQARASCQAALALTEPLAHAFSWAQAKYYAARLHQYRREAYAAQKLVETQMALSEEKGFAYQIARGKTLLGWAWAEQGRTADGIDQMRQGLAAIWTMSAPLARSLTLVLMAEALGNLGQAEEGLHLLTETHAELNKSGERFYEAELYRHRGELWQRLSPDPCQAEASFLQSLEIARRQQSKSLELRAAMSLARLWRRQNKRSAARELLASVFAWFTEGFDTADLKDAKQLLEELCA